MATIKRIRRVATGAAALAGATQMTNMHADTVVHTSNTPGGVTNQTNTDQVVSDKDLHAINGLVEQLQARSNGVVQIAPDVSTITPEEAEITKEHLRTLSQQMDRYRELKSQLDAQNKNMANITGESDVSLPETISGSIADVSTQLQSALQQMEQTVKTNQAVVDKATEVAGQNPKVMDAVKEHNTSISREAGDLKHFKDGIVGNMDAIKRKSDLSEAMGGLVVDNTQTQRVNTVETDQQTGPKVEVQTLDEARQEADRILQEIKEAQKKNVGESLRSADYRANALANIDDLNVWLKKEKAVVEDAKKQVELLNQKNNQMRDAMSMYQQSVQSELASIRALLEAEGAPAEVIQSIETANQVVSSSGLSIDKIGDVGLDSAVDFADIGQRQDVENGSTFGTIAETKKKASEQLSGAIESGMNDINASIQSAQQALNQSSQQNTDKVKKYLDQTQDMLNEYRIKMEAYQVALAAYEKEQREYKIAMEKYKTDQATYERKKKEYEDALKNYQVEKQAYDSKVAELRKQVEAKNAEIKKRYEQELADYEKRLKEYQDAVQQSGSNNAAAQQKYEQEMKEYQEKLAEYKRKHEEWLAGGGSSGSTSTNGVGPQIDTSRIKNWDLYNGNYSDIARNRYRQFIDRALKQTHDDVSNLAGKIKANTSPFVGLNDKVSMSTLSAAMYLANAGTIKDGFGSVLLNNKSVNNYPSDMKVHAKSVIADSQWNNVSVTDIIDALSNLPGGVSTANLPIVRDLKTQYLNTALGGAVEKNMRVLVTTDPAIEISLPYAFVFRDANGQTQGGYTFVRVEAKAYNGDDIASRLPKTASGSYPLYVHTIAINPFNGQLAVGTGYVAMQKPYVGWGSAFQDVGSGGEFMKAPMSVPESALGVRISGRPGVGRSNRAVVGTSGEALRWDFNQIGSPMHQVNSVRGIGLAQHIRVKVDGGAKNMHPYAKNAPLYVSDLDDGQEAIIYEGAGSTGTKIVGLSGAMSRSGLSDWKNPFGETGTAHVITSKNTDTISVIGHSDTNINDHALAVYQTGPNARGLMDTRITIRQKGQTSGTDAERNSYTAIDTALFAPFGFVGPGESIPNGDEPIPPKPPVPPTNDITPDEPEKPTPPTYDPFIPPEEPPKEPENKTPEPPTPPTPPKLEKPVEPEKEFTTLSLDTIQIRLKEMGVKDLEVKARTEGQYRLVYNLRYLKAKGQPDGRVQNLAWNLRLPSFKAQEPSNEKASSQSSFVVRQRIPKSNLTGSGNSLVIQSKKRGVSSHGNSLIVQQNGRRVQTAHGNSLVVRHRQRTNTSSSGNSLVVQPSRPTDIPKPPVLPSVPLPPPAVADKPQEALKHEHNHDVTHRFFDPTFDYGERVVPTSFLSDTGEVITKLQVYADPSMVQLTKEALEDWSNALKAHGVQLNWTISSQLSDLEKGAHIVVMEADNKSELVSAFQEKDIIDPVMEGFAGLTTHLAHSKQTPNGLNDVFNKQGTIRAGDMLKRSWTSIQINLDTIKQNRFQNIMMRGQLAKSVLKHEIGHVFGLGHINDDSLMTDNMGNASFTGEISEPVAVHAARFFQSLVRQTQ